MGVNNPEIKKYLSKLDVRIMKLDCGDESIFKLYNRPIVNTSLYSIVTGLADIPNITIQTLFTAGEHGNSKENQITQWIEKLKIIKPFEIQIYTLDRGYPSNKIYPVALDWLHNLETHLNNLGLKSKAYI